MYTTSCNVSPFAGAVGNGLFGFFKFNISCIYSTVIASDVATFIAAPTIRLIIWCKKLEPVNTMRYAHHSGIYSTAILLIVRTLLGTSESAEQNELKSCVPTNNAKAFCSTDISMLFLIICAKALDKRRWLFYKDMIMVYFAFDIIKWMKIIWRHGERPNDNIR